MSNTLCARPEDVCGSGSTATLIVNLAVGGGGPSALCANRFTPGGDQAFPIFLEPV